MTADILPFKRPKASDKHKGKILCHNGHHKWKLCKDKVFDVKAGKLVTAHVCERCGRKKVEGS